MGLGIIIFIAGSGFDILTLMICLGFKTEYSKFTEQFAELFEIVSVNYHLKGEKRCNNWYLYALACSNTAV